LHLNPWKPNSEAHQDNTVGLF